MRLADILLAFGLGVIVGAVLACGEETTEEWENRLKRKWGIAKNDDIHFHECLEEAWYYGEL